MNKDKDIRQMLGAQKKRDNYIKRSKKMVSEKELVEFSVEKLRAWRADWLLFASEVLGVTLDEEQAEILRSVQYNPMTTVASGTSRGKDFVSAVCAMCFLYLTPEFSPAGTMTRNTKVFMTAPTARQVRNIMQPEFSRLFRTAVSRGFPLVGRLVGSDIRTLSDEWYLTAFKADNQNEEAWSGLHAANIMFIITEASGISESIFNAIEGNLQGNSRFLTVFNPNITTGYAAKSMKSPRFKKFRLNSLKAANVVAKKEIITGQVNYEWVVDKLSAWCLRITKDEISEEHDDFEFEGKFYRPNDIFRRKVLGKFPKVSETKLIPQQWIEAANERWLKYNKSQKNSKQLILGVDVAGYGRDNCVYCPRYDDYVEEFKVFNYQGDNIHMGYAGHLFNILRLHTNSIAHVDNIGEGAGTFARLKELFDEVNPDFERVFSCKGSESAKDHNDRPLSDVNNQYKFKNKRAYVHWAVRDWLDPRNNFNPMLPPDDEFMEEATEIEYFFESSGAIQIEPKEDLKLRLGRSPDKFDSLATTFNPYAKIEPDYNVLDYI